MITDFSGHNWDDDAMNVLMDLVRFESLVATSPQGSHGSSMNNALPARHAKIVNGTSSTVRQTRASTTTTSSAQADQPASFASDLSHANLHGADLSHADLRGVNLARANLTEARLDHANLEQADLRGADLRSAHLAAAKLRDARLYGALFDGSTDLPFAKEDALRRGMIFLDVSSHHS
jgi:uncharacterized protein YjbI with pentapeptide repeats